MIEPQNTMMPLPAESARAEVPHGEAGFGEMLAQTLGMIPQTNPDVVQAVEGDQSGREQDADAMSDGEAQSMPGEIQAADARFVVLPPDGNES